MICENVELYNIRNKLLSDNTLLFHGSDGGIVGDLSVDVNRGLKDFGNGFYTTDNLLQAENEVVNKRNGIVYAYRYSLEGLNVYQFEDLVLWSLYIGYNRHFRFRDMPPKLLDIFDEIDSYDVIIGFMADDKALRVHECFLNYEFSDICMIELLKYVDYGKQFVFKTNKALSRISVVDSYVLTEEIKRNSLEWGFNKRESMERHFEYVKEKCRRKGLFVCEVLSKHDN